MSFDLIIRGGICLTPDGEREADIAITDGRIEDVGDLGQADAGQIIEARGLHILPGVIDTQVHFREPGAEHKEDLATGSQAAVLGGVTGVFEMPNTRPPTTTQEALEDKLARAKGRMYCHHAFYVGGTGETADNLHELERLPGCAGVKMFMGSSTGTLLAADDETVTRILANGKRRVAVHSEDEYRMRDRRELAKLGDVSTHPVWRDAETARLCTERLLKIARAQGRPVHVLHITTAEEMVLLAANKDIASVEVTPQHLTLAAPECYEELGTFAQMNPPIREARHRDALWAALQVGTVDIIGSDHSPHSREEKAETYPKSPSGMPGVQTLVPIMLDHMNAGHLSLERFVDLTSRSAVRLFGIKIGRAHV